MWVKETAKNVLQRGGMNNRGREATILKRKGMSGNGVRALKRKAVTPLQTVITKWGRFDVL